MKRKLIFLALTVLTLTFGCKSLRFTKETIFTENAPKPIGPYSQAVKVGKFVFVSGQIGINPKDGTISETTEAQFIQIMENIQNILKSAGAELSNVIKVTIYLKDLNDFQVLNSLYSKYFTTDYPARETIEVSRLPKDAKVEVSVIAFTKK